jgi:hypothetical protein
MPKKAAAKAKSEPKEAENAGPDEKVILQRKQESLKHQLGTPARSFFFFYKIRLFQGSIFRVWVFGNSDSK